MRISDLVERVLPLDVSNNAERNHTTSDKGNLVRWSMRDRTATEVAGCRVRVTNHAAHRAADRFPAAGERPASWITWAFHSAHVGGPVPRRSAHPPEALWSVVPHLDLLLVWVVQAPEDGDATADCVVLTVYPIQVGIGEMYDEARLLVAKLQTK